MELKLEGKAIVFGYARGFTFLYRKSTSAIPCYDIPADKIDQEWQRFIEALKETKDQLNQVKEKTIETFGHHESEIFDIQLALLEDSYILEQLRKKLSETKKNVEFCFSSIIEECLKRFKLHSVPSIRERYLDFDDVASRLLEVLLKNYSDNLSEKDLKGRILLAKSLTPSDVFFLKDKGINGIVLEEKCFIAHAIILAKSLNVPIIVGIENLCSLAKDNVPIEINGETGEVWLDSKESHSQEEVPLKNSVTNNLHQIELYVAYNEFFTEKFLEQSSIAGIGLLRSEILFLSKSNTPDEEEQFTYYKEVITKAHGKTVILRTLDIGGDKIRSAHPEKSSPLGLRGIRWSLKNIPEFKIQLRAMLRASAFGNTKILYPMISSEQEIIQANKILELCKQELKTEHIPFKQNIEIGAMLETPCSFLIMDVLANHCSFFSIGTNDLIQYLLAIDRTDNEVADAYDWKHPAVLRTLQYAIKHANKLNAPIYMCGELPNIPEALSFCIGLGFKKFTISADRLTSYQKLVSEIDLSSLQANVNHRLKNL